MHVRNNQSSAANRRTAFTLVEIMVVVTIIGLLLAALLPAFNTVRTKAKVAQTSALFNAIDTGITLFQSETALGGTLPPSASDNPDDRHIIANPREGTTIGPNNGGAGEVVVAGAHLLVHALVGADGLGTPGFRDLDRDGQWWDNTNNTPGDPPGLYEILENEPRYTRYGAPGYVDEKAEASLRSIQNLVNDGSILSDVESLLPSDTAVDEDMFTDAWGLPVLYYRANRSARRLVGTEEMSGTYYQDDNGIITGTTVGTRQRGIDFGAGVVDGFYHAIERANSPDVTVTVEDIYEESEMWAQTFARYIIDPRKQARQTAYRDDSYILISAGPDFRYGTADDIANFDRALGD